MIAVVVALLAALRSTVRSRAESVAEILALRHQVAVLRRQAPVRLRLRRIDRFVRVVLSRAWSGWRLRKSWGGPVPPALMSNLVSTVSARP